MISQRLLELQRLYNLAANQQLETVRVRVSVRSAMEAGLSLAVDIAGISPLRCVVGHGVSLNALVDLVSAFRPGGPMTDADRLLALRRWYEQRMRMHEKYGFDLHRAEVDMGWLLARDAAREQEIERLQLGMNNLRKLLGFAYENNGAAYAERDALQTRLAAAEAALLAVQRQHGFTFTVVSEPGAAIHVTRVRAEEIDPT